LANNNIIVNYNMLPGDKDARNPSGLRIGVQEMTRYGMKESEIGQVAVLMKDVLKGADAKEAVTKLRSKFVEIHYA